MNRLPQRAWSRILTVLLGAVLVLSCGPKKDEVVVVTAEGARATAGDIDDDAWKLLPPGAVIWFRASATEAFASEFGPQMKEFLEESLPFAQGAGVQPEKDIEIVVGGIYATVGSDAVVICKGRFKKDATHAAIEKSPQTKLGLPIQTTEYSGAKMHVADEVAMAILTDRTMVFGTQLGVRRVLERVEEGRLNRKLPPWFEALLSDGAAQFQVGVDLDSQPIPAAFGEKLSFLEGLRAARILGNFKKPGLNMAGTLTYKEPGRAEAAAGELRGARDDMGKYSLIFAALGIPQPIERLEAQAVDKDTQFAIELEGTALAKILDNASQFVEDGAAKEWLPN